MRKSHAPSVRNRIRNEGGPVQPEIVQEEDVVRRFQVLYGRISTKITQKTFEKDGILELSRGSLILRDEDGYTECYMPYTKNIRLQDDAVIIIEPKEVKIVREIGVKRIKVELEVDPYRRFPGQTESPEREFKLPWQEIKKEKEEKPVVTIKIEKDPVKEKEDPPIQSHVPVIQPRPVIIETPRPVIPEQPRPATIEQPRPVPIEHPPPVLSEPLKTDSPLIKEELIICCKPTKRQIVSFQAVLVNIEENEDKEDPINKLWEICNEEFQSNGKVNVLLGIAQAALAKNQTVLIVAVHEEIVSGLFEDLSLEFNNACKLLKDEKDVQEVTKDNTSKVFLIRFGLLELLQTHNMTVDRTIVYENFSEEDENVLREITGPVYHLILSGSVEERMLQMKHEILPEIDHGMRFLAKPGDHFNSETHELMSCDCQGESSESEEDDELPVFERKTYRLDTTTASDDIRDWQHIPGSLLQPDHLQDLDLSTDSASSIVFIFKRRT